MIESQILKENRNFAELEVNKQKRYNEILECLGDRELTAKEIAYEMYKKDYIPTYERNFTSPRLTELLRSGKVKVSGKRKCEWTGKTVSVFKIRED